MGGDEAEPREEITLVVVAVKTLPGTLVPQCDIEGGADISRVDIFLVAVAELSCDGANHRLDGLIEEISCKLGVRLDLSDVLCCFLVELCLSLGLGFLSLCLFLFHVSIVFNGSICSVQANFPINTTGGFRLYRKRILGYLTS